MNKNILRQIINIVAVVATIVVNSLANIIPFNGLQTGQISDQFKVFFVPAGYVFAIWGVIYIGLIAFAIYQAIPAQRENPRLVRIGYLFTFSCLANIVWLFLWHYEYFVLTLFAMLGLLFLLIAIYLILDINRTPVSAGERWLVHLPFSIYLGWITVATIANVTDVLDYLKWTGWGISPQLWAVLMLAAAVAIAAAVSITRADAAYLLVLVWALAGIAVKQSGTPLVATSSWIATVLAGLLIPIGFLARKRSTALNK
jgi:benzodiazapine receptor